jgi:hypothetical protein
MTKKASEWNSDDYKSHIADLSKELASAPTLLRYLDKHCPEDDLCNRAPFGLISGTVKPGDFATIKVRPYVTMRPIHILLSEVTATSFDMTDWVISNMRQTCGDCPIPLETFSVKYTANLVEPERLLQLQTWSHETITPGMEMRMTVYNISHAPVAFRGILWARTSVY